MKFGKIFEQMYDSSISNNWKAMVTFQQLIIMCSYPEGVIDMTPRSIAARCGIPDEIIREGLTVLGQPDPESRSKDAEGRRIVPLLDETGAPRPWGWRIVNYDKYRKKMADEERRVYKSEWAKADRAATRAESTAVPVVPSAVPVESTIVTERPRGDDVDTGDKEESKRREEEEGGNGKLLDLPTLPRASSSKSKLLTASPFVLTLKDGSMWSAPWEALKPFVRQDEGDVLSLDRTLPLTALEESMTKLARRTLADPTQRPTRRGAPAKVVNWLTNEIKFRNRDAKGGK